MTLNEAIQHAEAIANGQCGECAEEHRQLAEWLKELKERRKAERHGHWINKKDGVIPYVECSVCGTQYGIGLDNYCPHCGAKMGEEENDDKDVL